MHVNIGLANNAALYKKTSVWMVSPQCCNKAASDYHIQLQSLIACGLSQGLCTVLLKNCFQRPKEVTERDLKVHFSPTSPGAKGAKPQKSGLPLTCLWSLSLEADWTRISLVTKIQSLANEEGWPNINTGISKRHKVVT